MTMQPYKGYFIDGTALLVHPFSSDWYVGDSILLAGRSTSIVEITRFHLQQFTVSMKELAEWFRPGDCPDRGGRAAGCKQIEP